MDVDIDNDFDGKFLDQFRSMGTTDRDVLIAEFQQVLGNKINAESCAFFLDMNNWNLQNAVCSYYDFEQPSHLPSMTLLGETTIGEGEAVAPNSTFVKSWKIKNSGTERWPPGCHLLYCSGDNLYNSDRAMVDALLPGEVAEIVLQIKSPAQQGSYYSTWKMSTATGNKFGDEINCHVVVSEGGLLSLTQQLARIGGGGAETSPGLPAGAVQQQQQQAQLLQHNVELQQIQQQQQQVSAFLGQTAIAQAPAPPVQLPDGSEDAEMS